VWLRVWLRELVLWVLWVLWGFDCWILFALAEEHHPASVFDSIWLLAFGCLGWAMGITLYLKKVSKREL
jgi:drug/metabolite transporter (DMT)-like permease